MAHSAGFGRRTPPPAKQANSFERLGRQVKVGRLLAALDALFAKLEPGADDDRKALWCTGALDEDRARLAVLAGCKPASPKTWGALIDAIHARKDVSARFDGIPDPTEP
jgi:hypothetical protein